MRKIGLLALLGATVVVGSALAQAARDDAGSGPSSIGTTGRQFSPPPPRASERPLDRGPFTPEASRAYNGGGMVLEGPPGTPAPAPQPTAPPVAPQGAPPPPAR